MFSTFIVLIFVSPLHILFIGVMMVFMGMAVKTYIRVVVELKRMSKLSQTPVLSRVTEMINGIAEIRAYGQEERFKKRFVEFSFMKATIDFHEAMGEAWIKIRIEYPIAIILTLTMAALTFGKDFDYI